MNIFLPYENDIVKSVQSLDDRRLVKQVLETYQLLNNAVKEINGEEIKGYKNHPIYLHYKDDCRFLSVYGFACCEEYRYRFYKPHKLAYYFDLGARIANSLWAYERATKKQGDYNFGYTPFYMEGSKGQPNYIRTTENVSELYQRKLCAKWDSDKAKGRQPKWTDREVPSFYKEWCDNENKSN